jgi:group I intron endonuclease
MYIYIVLRTKKTNMNYENSKIYKLVNDIDDKIYVGSTATTLAKRLYGHKNSAKRKPDTHVYRHLNTVGWDNVRIVLIESIVVQNKDQLRMNEQRYIDELRPELNKNAAYVNCPHGNNYHQCKKCCGSSICEHNRYKSQCKDCCGSRICEHNRQKSTCRECGGSQICEHNRHKSQCKDCCGSKNQRVRSVEVVGFVNITDTNQRVESVGVIGFVNITDTNQRVRSVTQKDIIVKPVTNRWRHPRVYHIIIRPSSIS